MKTFSPATWKKRASAERIGVCIWNKGVIFLPAWSPVNTRERILAGVLTFLNHEHQLGFPFDWNVNNVSKLWEYNLHYFDYIFALDYDQAKTLVLDWINHYEIQRGRCGWDPYPVSLRVMNWCMYFYGFFRRQTETDAPFQKTLHASLALQMQWLWYRREYHLLGNHYLENAAALALVGSCFAGRDSQLWFEQGLNILERELPEQMLADGMHFERSPMYHCRATYLLHCCMQTRNERLAALVEPYYEKAKNILPLITHPDRQIALLNDSAFGIYHPPSILKTDWPGQICSQTFALPDAGYFGAMTGRDHYVIIDAGKIGPDYIPGHAHGDIFSFELSFFGKRMIVDSGVYNYVASPERKYSRSTAAHNTVEVKGRDQCEFFDAFKVGRRARPHDVKFEEWKTGFRLSSWHDGYCFHPSKAIHRRSFEWNHCGELQIIDTITAQCNVKSILRFHFHPECNVHLKDESIAIVERDSVRCQLHLAGNAMNLNCYDYSPEFGVKVPGTVLEIAAYGSGKTICATIKAD